MGVRRRTGAEADALNPGGVGFAAPGQNVTLVCEPAVSVACPAWTTRVSRPHVALKKLAPSPGRSPFTRTA